VVPVGRLLAPRRWAMNFPHQNRDFDSRAAVAIDPISDAVQ
jgi:hypothetical protein